MVIRSGALYRLAAVSGGACAIVLLINAAKRAAIIPTSDTTQLVAPLAEVFALGLVIALFLGFGRRTGVVGAVAFVANFIALAGLVGVE